VTPSCCFGGGHGEGVVAEAGDQAEPSAGCIDVARDGADGGDLTALDLRYPPRRDAHRLGGLSLGEPRRSARCR